MSYVDRLVAGLWTYKDLMFPIQDELFDEARPRAHGSRPPVFTKPHAWRNVLLDPCLTEKQRDEVVGAIRPWKRHRWFRSMKSSQALTQCVFGSLRAVSRLDALAEIAGNPFRLQNDGVQAELEHAINYLGEAPSRCTSVDVLLSGNRRVAIECKLTEVDMGRCSRPRLASEEPDHCDGSYSHQRRRLDRCSLTAIGVKYWQYVPHILRWNAAIDLMPCPLSHTYQIVRNLLAACVLPSGECSLENGTAVLLIDARNPAFQNEGPGRKAFDAVRAALLNPDCLQLCTWQEVLQHLRKNQVLNGLTEQINSKYGI